MSHFRQPLLIFILSESTPACHCKGAEGDCGNLFYVAG